MILGGKMKKNRLIVTHGGKMKKLKIKTKIVGLIKNRIDLLEEMEIIIKVTLVNAEANTLAELSTMMLRYGKEGYKYAYSHEYLDSQILLTDSEIDLDNYEGEIQDIEESILSMKEKSVMEYELSDGVMLILLKERVHFN